MKCYNRFDQNYQGPTNNNNNSFFASTESVGTLEWLFDSGANHITTNANNLNKKIEYRGGEKLVAGNGQELPIYNTGTFVLHSNNGIINLKNILHVPGDTRNLLSILKLTFDNNAIVDFHPFSVFVKDKVLKRVLLQRTLRDGLY